MKFAYLYLISEFKFNDPETYIESSHRPHTIFQEIKTEQDINIHIVQRAPFKIARTINNIDYYFIKDEFDHILRWWQEPEAVFQLLADIQPDLIHVCGLNLPLQFRWLRRIVGENVIIVGEHTGETIWAHRNLWLQQFGLRVVDGFIFKKLKEAEIWIKSSAILEKQPVAEIPYSKKDPNKTAKLLMKFYSDLMAMKATMNMK
jgi:hypothetical protein